ncbi:MAG: branched-chain amino acid ABC transporter substrate-binding protein [Candidatus Pacebacteria bacterium]|nr:branched-chain amino acid ABC transporter substrate-binding protein [Candidatus Paceibacterota bacterium]
MTLKSISKHLTAAVAVTAIMQLASPLVGKAMAADLSIGLAAPITGPNAALGTQVRNGAKMAAADINARGGILGNQIVVVEQDDASDPKQAVSVANKFVSQKVTMLVGHVNSGTSIPASDVYKEENILAITPSATNVVLTDRGYPNLFRICGRDDKQGQVAGNYLLKNFKGKNIAIIHDKTAYGQGLAVETKKTLNAGGGKEVLFESINPGEKDYSAEITKLKSLKVDAIFYGGYHPEAGLLVRQGREQGLKALLIGGDALTTDEFWGITGDAGEGTIFTNQADSRELSTAKDVVAKFRAQNIDPDGYTLNAYAAFQVLEQAAIKAKSVKTTDMQKVMHGGTFDTVVGKISFDAKGDVVNPNFVFFQFSKGTYAQVK